MEDSTGDFDYDGDGDIDADDEAWGELIFLDAMLHQETYATEQPMPAGPSDVGSDRAWLVGLVVLALLIGSIFCELTK